MACAHAVCAGEGSLRYRGHYTLGHEVNVFCPDINSWCYWLGSGTADEARRRLKSIVKENASKPYEPVCVVLEANIDPRAGISTIPALSADYAGLIMVSRVFGLCSETEVITQGDLQHHRWVLTSIDDVEIDTRILTHVVPELDFGELMFVSVHTGCNQYSGKAELSGTRIRLDVQQDSWMSCSADQEKLEEKLLSVLRQEPSITIGHERSLILESGATSLRYRLQDWVR